MENILDKCLFVTITRNSLANIDEFISIWSKGYSYPNMEFYTDMISKEQIGISDLQKLFEWKNGMTLSTKKTKSVEENVLKKVSIVNQLKQQWNKEIFEKEFSSISTIWQIFLLHIIQPENFPI